MDSPRGRLLTIFILTCLFSDIAKSLKNDDDPSDFKGILRREKDANADAETSAEQKINICDFKGGEIDFPHPPSENQGLILQYSTGDSVDSKSSCDVFIGNSHNMHYQLEIVSFDENVQEICKDLYGPNRPFLKILQMRDVIDVSNDQENSHRLRITDLCQLFGLMVKYKKSLPHSFKFNGKKDIHNILGMIINGRMWGPSFKFRLTRIPTPPKKPITVAARSPIRLQCLSACPLDEATLFYVDESDPDRILRDITNRATTETISSGQNRPILENIVIEGEPKGFRRSCSGRTKPKSVAKLFKIQVEDTIAESGTYIFSFGNEEDSDNCTFILKAGRLTWEELTEKRQSGFLRRAKNSADGSLVNYLDSPRHILKQNKRLGDTSIDQEKFKWGRKQNITRHA